MLFRHAAQTRAPLGSAPPGGVIVERPAPGLARGRYPASPLFITTLSALLVLVTLIHFYLRLRKNRQ